MLLKFTPMNLQKYIDIFNSKGYCITKSMTFTEKLKESEKCIQDIFNKRPEYFKRCLNKISAIEIDFKVDVIDYIQYKEFGAFSLRLKASGYNDIICYLYYYCTRLRIYIPIIRANNIKDNKITTNSEMYALSPSDCLSDLRQAFGIN